MKRKFFAAVLCALVWQTSFVIFPSETFAQRRGTSYKNSRSNFGGEEFEIFELVNRRRQKSRLGQLEWDGELAEMARRYSQEMARGNFFSHYDKRGGTVTDRAERFGIRGWRGIGENLFFCEGLEDFSGVAVKGWLDSSAHRKNMLSPEWTATGIGVASDRAGRIYVTQVFIK